jgi:hypothetical protein
MIVSRLKPRSKTRGVILIEFIMVAFGLTAIIFMGVQFGLLMTPLQVTGEGARVAARDAATKPGALVLPADNSSLYVDPGVFEETYTVIDVGTLSGTLDDLFASLPAVHTTLRAEMFLDSLSIPGRSLLRFKGVLLRNAGGALIVRVPEIAGSTATLRRIIDPPLAVAADGTVRMECHQWFEFTSWFLGGSAIPGSLTYLNLPAGYSVVSIDLEPGSRRGLEFESFAIGRKEIQ